MRWVTGIALRVVGFGLIWVALAGWSADTTVYGVVSVFAATVLSLTLLPPGRPQPRRWLPRVWGTIRLTGWFLQQSVLGGVDVARRALTPRIDIAPRIVDVEVAIPEGPGREVCYLLMNLLPGSMVQRVRTRDDRTVAEIHTLSLDLEPAVQWERLQRRVAQAFQVGDDLDAR